MSLWHDPLEELIGELERTVTSEADSADFGLGSLEGLQLYVQAVLYGSAEELARVERDPRVRAYLADVRRLGVRSGA